MQCRTSFRISKNDFWASYFDFRASANYRYSWIGHKIRADKKLICQRTRRVTTLLRPPLESSRQGESKSAVYIFVRPMFGLFLITFRLTSEQKHTRKIWIFRIDYSCAEVSDPSEVPRVIYQTTYLDNAKWSGDCNENTYIQLRVIFDQPRNTRNIFRCWTTT